MTSSPTGWQTDGDSWAAYTETYGGSRTGVFHGTHYSGSNYYAFTHQVVRNLPNGTYTLRAWVKGSGGQTKAYLLARNFGGGLQYVSIPATPNGPDGEWILLELPNLQVTNGQCDIGFESQAAPHQFIYFEDVELFRQPDAVPAFTTRNTFGGNDHLLATENADEGRTEYVYARDGRVRFSQSAVQRQQGKFSYSNYDEIGRVVESGEYTMPSPAPQNTVLAQLEAEAAQTNGQVEYGVAGASNGQDVGYLTEDGRYVAFQGAVPRTGTYVLEFRYSSGLGGARTMSLYVDGVDVQQLTLPTTNGWTAWATQQVVVPLTAGNHTVTLQKDADDSGWINLDYLKVLDLTQGLVFENQLPKVSAYEAEYFQTNATVNTNHPGYRGTGFVGDIVNHGHYLQATVTVAKAGRYSLQMRYAAGIANSTRTMPVYVNWSYVKHAVFPSTNSWATWATQTLELDLREGANLIRFQHDNRDDEGWFNLDYLEVAEEKQPTGSSVLYLLEDRTPSGGLDVARCSQRTQIWYDEPQADQPVAARTQEFVLGAVAKSSNGTATTWYSYDELGRVTWLAQKLPGVGVKTVDYTYDLKGNVRQVAYQQGQPDAFYHHFEYDADQRLHAVYTSRDGMAANRSLQAKYFYYLHGPLKRAEVGERLQGLDYTYTVQGWLKNINQATKRLDPGADKPTGNGFYKDLFGLTLDYFSGDYASRQLTPPTPTIAVNQDEVRYDGTVRATSWQTAAAATVHANAYRYDAKGQLKQADYGQMTNNTFVASATNAYEEGNLSYDANGNLLTLRRRDGAGMSTDDFNYSYTANTNQLAQVKNQAGATVLGYEYDADGQMVRETEAGKGDKYLAYNVTGKVTGVYRDAARQQPVVTFAYNDRGFRVSKTAYSAQGVAQATTYYVTDVQGNVLSTYEQPAGGTLAQTELPLYGADRVGTLTRLDANLFEARYELNDQLGNARVVFRKPTTTTYLASMEPSQASQEEQHFQNLPATRTFNTVYAYDGTHVARIAGNTGAAGPAITLDVTKGDTLTFAAWTVVPYAQRSNAAARIIPFAAAGLAAGGQAVYAPDRTRRAARASQWLGRLAAGIAITGWGNHQPLAPGGADASLAPTAIPMTMLRYRLRNTNGDLVSEQYVSVGSSNVLQQLKLGVRTKEAGTVEMTLTSTIPDQVLFDHVEAKHTTGMIVQEQHQYAFGSPIVGLNYTVGTKKYRHGYQGQFAEKDEETGWDSFEMRMYNSRIGRWMAPDPVKTYASQYVGMGNNPIMFVDKDGKDIFIVQQGFGGSFSGEVERVQTALAILESTPMGQAILSKFKNNPNNNLYLTVGSYTSTSNIQGSSAGAVTIRHFFAGPNESFMGYLAKQQESPGVPREKILNDNFEGTPNQAPVSGDFVVIHKRAIGNSPAALAEMIGHELLAHSSKGLKLKTPVAEHNAFGSEVLLTGSPANIAAADQTKDAYKLYSQIDASEKAAQKAGTIRTAITGVRVVFRIGTVINQAAKLYRGPKFR